MEPLGDHLEEFRQQDPFPRREPRILQQLLLSAAGLDRQEMFPPVEKLQSAVEDKFAMHGSGYTTGSSSGNGFSVM